MKTCPVCGEQIPGAAECWRCGSRWEAGGAFRPGTLQRGARRPGRRRKRPLLADDEKWVSGDDAAWTGCCLVDVLGWFWPAAALVLIAVVVLPSLALRGLSRSVRRRSLKGG